MNHLGLLVSSVLFLLISMGCENKGSSPGFTPGAPCDPVQNAPDARCNGDTLTYCDTATERVTQYNCAIAGGTCEGVGATAECNVPLPLGTSCSPTADNIHAFCNIGNVLTYCDSETNLVKQLDCSAEGGTCTGAGRSAQCEIPFLPGRSCIPGSDDEKSHCTIQGVRIYCDSATDMVADEDCVAPGGECLGEGASTRCYIPPLELDDPCVPDRDGLRSRCTESGTLILCDPLNSTVREDDCWGGIGACDDSEAVARCVLPLVAGQPCDSEADPRLDFCLDDVLSYCGSDGRAIDLDCTGETCDGVCTDSSCECLWQEGNTCEYPAQYNESECLGENLLQCGATGVIVSVNCRSYCRTRAGKPSDVDGHACGVEKTGYGACECSLADCTAVETYCYDPQYLVNCNDWTDCNAQCLASDGSSGRCDGDTNTCICG